ncbi:MAG: 4Fe-4S dicluster domain-containing protein [candidate division WOR-3 bacterium]
MNEEIKLKEEIEELSRQRLLDCYQCGECSAGCPTAFAMDIVPSHSIRLLQLGKFNEVLNADNIWLCVACHVCGERCPRGVDYGKIADALRTLILRNKITHLTLEKIDKQFILEAPQQAFIAAFRKFTT